MNFKLSIFAAAFTSLLCTQAQAGFYVNDDAPVITAAHPEAARKDKTVYASFTGSKLQGTSRGEIEASVDALPSVDAVVLTTFARTGKQLAAANHRLASVKAILIRKGIPAERISVDAELDPQADSTDTDVQVTFRSSTQRPTADALRSARFMQPAPVQVIPQTNPAYAYPAAVAAPAGASTTAAGLAAGSAGQNGAKLEFVKKIMAMASSKLISQESAVKLVSEYLANMAPGQNSPAELAQQGASATPAAPQIVPFGEVPRVWTLAANKSLRDNLREWSIAAGYGEPTWKVSEPYQVTYSSTYTGTFLEVLNQVSKFVPALDFNVSRAAHHVDVVDHI